MLDINYIREAAGEVKQACKDKQLNPQVVDELLAVDEKRRAKQVEVDNLRQQSNEHNRVVKQAVAGGQKPTSEQIETGKKIKEQIKNAEPALVELEKKYGELMMQIPNPPAADVPVGVDESGNQVIRQVGELPKFDFEPKSHQEIMENLGWLDTKRAVRAAGFRAYFLQGDGLKLEQKLLQMALERLVAAGFTPMSVPVMVNEETLWGTGYFPWGKEDHYQTQDGQYLTGTAEVALTAYRMGETLNESELPFQICGISPCFRREVGSHGKDTQGIIRVHQFNKVEQVVYTVADEEESRKWHEKMTELAEKMLQDLGLSYQVLAMCTGDMGAGQRKKYDIETWFPAQNKYRETHSASYFNDFQSRRLGIKYRTKSGELKHVYTLNNTMAATPRLLAACVENWQTKDGGVELPRILEN